MLGILRELKVYTLIRCAYVVPVSKDDVKLHWHDYYQFVYARKGKGAIVTETETIPLSEKEAVIIRRKEPHALVSYSDRFETYEVKFVLCDDRKDLLQDGPRYICRDAQGEINLSLRQMERESDKLDGLSREIVAVEMYKILLLMRRELDKAVEAEASDDVSKEDTIGDKLLHKIDAFIEKNMGRNIMVKDVADHVCIEYKYFSHYFASRYGMRLKQYIAAKQLEKVKELLVSTELGTAEIAEICGFSDGRQLARMFKASEKLSPTEFRKQFQVKHAVNLEKAPDSYWKNTTGKTEADNL